MVQHILLIIFIISAFLHFTLAECKSGYGLVTEHEIKMLKVLQADLLTWSELPLDGRAGFMSFETEADYTDAWTNKTNVYWEAKSMFVPGTLVFITTDKKLMMIDDDILRIQAPHT